METVRIPKWEIAIQVGSLLVLPIWNAIQGIVDGRAFWLVLLTTLGTIAILLVIIAAWNVVRPRRTRLVTDVELMNRIDEWLRDAGFGRTNLTLAGFTHSIAVTWAGQTVYVMKNDVRPQLVIAGSRQATAQDIQTFLQNDSSGVVRTSVRYCLGSRAIRRLLGVSV